MAKKKVVIALGTSVFNSNITQKKLSIDKLFENLKEPVYRKKKDGPYFVFASFKGEKRNASAVKFYYGATLDLDNSDITPKGIMKVLKPLKCRYCIYTTHSHKAEGKGNRYRVVIPYIEPVSKGKHVETTIYLNYLFGSTGVDTSAKALSRPMYLPACPRTMRQHFYYHATKQQALLDPEQKIEVPAELLWEQEELNNAVNDKVDITQELTEGGRNDHIAKVAGTLIGQGKPLQEIMDFCWEINELKFSPPMKLSEIKTTVKSVWKSHSRNHNDLEWSHDQIVERIQKSDSLENDIDHILTMAAASVQTNKTSPIQLNSMLKKISARVKDVSLADLKSEIKSKIKTQKVEKTEAKERLDIDDDLDGPVVDKYIREFDDFYYIASENIIFNRRAELEYKPEGFNTKNTEMNEDFGYTKLSPFKILTDIGAVKKVDARRYSPGHERTFRDPLDNRSKLLNTYCASSVKPKKGKTKLLRAHFEYLFPDEYERNIVLEFIAYNFQNPGKKVMWAPIIKGRKGIGKSVIASKIIKPIFGPKNINELNTTQPLEEKFNSWQSGSQMVLIHELYAAKARKTITENLKSFITEDTVKIRAMQKDYVTLPNVTNMLAFTNHEDALFVTPDERRFCMLRCEAFPRDAEYYAKLVKYLETHVQAIAYFFLNLPIVTIDPYNLPTTTYTKQVMRSSLDWAESIVKDELDDTESMLNKYTYMTWKSLCQMFLLKMHQNGGNVSPYEAILGTASKKTSELKHALNDAGFHELKVPGSEDGRLRVNGKRQSAWVMPMTKDVELDAKHKAKIIAKLEKCEEEVAESYQTIM